LDREAAPAVGGERLEMFPDGAGKSLLVAEVSRPLSIARRLSVVWVNELGGDEKAFERGATAGVDGTSGSKVAATGLP
jgi:hypothetical protein